MWIVIKGKVGAAAETCTFFESAPQLLTVVYGSDEEHIDMFWQLLTARQAVGCEECGG
jgi:hypothetical protein